MVVFGDGDGQCCHFFFDARTVVDCCSTCLFCFWAVAGMGEITVNQAQEEFRLADADGNGYLDSTELVAVMEKLNVTLGRTQLER